MTILPPAPYGGHRPVALGDGHELMVTKPKDALAVTTSLVRSQNLAREGYVAEEGDRPGVWIVTGPDSTIKKTGVVVPHGPYTVDILGETCDCRGFENRGACPHIGFAQDWAAGRLPSALGEALQKGIWGIGDGKGRFLATSEGLIYAYRAEGLASAAAVASKPVHGDLAAVELPLGVVMSAGRYSGLLLITMNDPKGKAIRFGMKAKPESEPEENPFAEDRAASGKVFRLSDLDGLGGGPAPTPRPYRFPQMEDYDNAA
jgi:hypothetical protein